MSNEARREFKTARERIRFWFEDLSTPMGRATDLSVTALIVIACCIAVATMSYDENKYLIWADHVITALFVIEYGLRLWSAETRIRYLFSLYSFIDLMAILPAVPLPMFRIFRLLRIFRLIRFLEDQEFFFGRIEEIHLYLIRVGFTLLSIPFVSAGLIFYVEKEAAGHKIDSFFDAFYYSVVTLTTVGFGDFVTVTPAGRMITILMIVAGIVFIPWQVKNVIAHFLTSRSKVFLLCAACGHEYHERDAWHCKQCGAEIRQKPSDEEGLR